MNYPESITASFSQRDPLDGVDALFHQRWSPRSFRKTDISENDLATLFDAARWSPSCFNEQPWRFHTSTASTFDLFFDLLTEGNQSWAGNASVLGFMVAARHFARNDKPNDYAEFDTGAAWMALTLQARKLGLYTHGMGGIHHDEVYEKLDIDKAKFRVICGFAIGVIDTPDKLPDNKRDMEKPSPRKPLSEIWLPAK